MDADEVGSTIIGDVKSVTVGRGDDGANYLDVVSLRETTTRHPVISNAYLLNESGKTIERYPARGRAA